MNLSAQFKEYLLSKASSKATVKNYLSDISKFVKWFEAKFNKSFDPSEINNSTIELFKAESNEKYSAASVERSISTLRKFFTFLKLEDIIKSSPFDISEASKADATKSDPWRIKDFKNHLYVFNASHLTIKNYIIDIKQFASWADKVLVDNSSWEVNNSTNIEKLDARLIEEYKKRLINEAGLSPVSVNRKLSSLRKYLTWAEQEGIIKSNIEVLNESKLDSMLPPVSVDPDQAQIEQSAESSDRSYSWFPPLRLAQKASFVLTGITDSLFILPLVQAAHKIDYALWIAKGRPVTEAGVGLASKIFSSKQNMPVKIRNVKKEFYAPALVSTKYFPIHKKVWHHVKNTRPEWYKRYQSYSFVRYMQAGILMLLISVLGYAVYSNIDPNKQQPKTLAALPTAPPRVLSFQGRLTDVTDNPITSQKAVRFAIYNSPSASGAALLWQEIVSPTPDTDGIFSVILGNNTTIPQSVFAENSALYLGVTIEQTAELTPRQQIATVAFATNAETLQGLEPITNSANTSNVVLALNSSGNLSIGGSANPTFQATGGTFTLQGTALILSTTTGSNGNVQLIPNGIGKIDTSKPILNSTNNNNISTAVGAVEVNDLFAILATSSGQSAFTLNQTSTGPLISASTSGIARFTVDNAGNITAAGTINGLTVSSGTISSGTWNGTAIGSQYGGTGLNTSASTGVPTISSGTWSVLSQLSTALGGLGANVTAAGAGELLYSTSATTYDSLAAGTGTQCLLGGTTPSWGSCGSGISSDTFWQQGSGALYPSNSTVDFLLGGQATTSAKFAVLGINSARGLQTASVSGSIVLDSSTASINTTNNQTLAINTNGGNVGIGTNSPLAKLQVNNSADGTLLRLQRAGGSNLPIFQFNFTESTNIIEQEITGASAPTLTWKLGGSERMRIDSSGRLGIGTSGTTATALLDVAGAASVGGQLTFRSGTAAIQSTAGQTLTLGGTTTGLVNINNKSGSAFTTFDTVNSRVGIGTTTPDTLLSLFQSGGAAGDLLHLRDNTDTSDLVIRYDGTSTYQFRSEVGGSGNLILALDLNGNVGVGTNTPTALLDVAGTASVGGQFTFRSGTAAIQSTANQTLTLGGNTTGNISLMPLNGIGGVGVGTSTPRGLLNVRGYTGGTGTSTVASFTENFVIGANAYNQTYNSGNAVLLHIADYSNDPGDNVYPIYVESENNDVAFFINGGVSSNAGFAYFGGSVGIGDTTPDSLFTVGSTSQFQVNSSGAISAATGITSAGTITFSGFTSNGGVLYTNGSGVLAQATAGTGTQCLLGGTTPTFGTCTGATTDAFWNQGSGALYPSNSTVDFLLGGQATTSAKFAVLNVNGTGPATASVSGDIIVMPRNGAGGRLGIGTTSPTDLLSISGKGQVIASVTSTDAISANFIVNSDDPADAAAALSAGGNSNFLFSNNANFYIQARSKANVIAGSGDANDSKFTILGSTGSIGIGTNTPISELHVTRPLSWGTTGKALAIFDQIENQDIFTASASGTTRFVIQNSGNVGIGTTSPGYPLVVNGQSQLGTAAGSPGVKANQNILLYDFSANNWAGIQSNSSGDINFSVGTSTRYTPLTLMANSGNVGIGTTAPGKALEINSATGANLRLTYNDSDGSATNYADLSMSSSGDLTITPSGGDTNIVGAIAAGSASQFQVASTGLLSINTGTGGPLIYVNESGSGYANGNAAIVADTDNPTGTANYLYQGRLDGTNVFSVMANGYLQLAGGLTSDIDTLTNTTLKIGATSATTLTLGRSGQGITLPAFTSNGGVLYTNGSGVLAQATAGTGTQCLLGGTTPTFGTCTGATTDAFWNQTLGALHANNSTVDFLVGGQATTSAKFAVLNVNSGTPTASVAGNFTVMPWTNGSNQLGGNVNIGQTSGSLQLNIVASGIPNTSAGIESIFYGSGNTRLNMKHANGTKENPLATANGNRLYVMNGSGYDGSAFITGAQILSDVDGTVSTNIVPARLVFTTMNSLGTLGERMRIDNSGKLGLGTSSPASELHVTRALSFGATGKALAIFDQIENQDIFTASASGTTRFVIQNGGNVGIGTSTPGQKLTVYGGIIGEYLASGDNPALYAGTGDTSNTYARLYNTSGTTDFGQGNGTSFINTNGQNLTISGPATITSTSTTSFDTSAALVLGTTTLTLDSNSTINGGSAANDDITIQGTSNATRTTSYVNLQPTAGNVGIGTSAPAKQLEVGNLGNSEGFRLSGTVANHTLDFNLVDSGGSYYFNILQGSANTAPVYFLGGSSGSTSVLGVRNNGGSFNSMSFYHNDTIGAIITSSTTNLFLSPGGGNVIFGDGDTIAIGGVAAGLVYNAISNSGGATSQGLSSDNDLFIEGDLETNGVFYADGGIDTTFTSNGGVLYTNGSGVLAQATAGTGTQCLLGGTTPTFGTCTGATTDAFWNQTLGALHANNSTVDFLVGGQATTSAKFAILGVNGTRGLQTASVAGSLTLDSTIATIQTTNNRSLSINPNGGNIGIGTSAPGGLLEIYNNYSPTKPSLKFRYNDGADYAMTIQPYVVGGGNVGYKFSTQNSGGSFTDALAITGTGNVGIGTTSPGYGLDVYNAGGNVIRGGANGDFIFSLAGGVTAGTQLFSIRNNSTGVVHLNTQNSADLAFGVSTGATAGSVVAQMIVKTSGNVGIGTTAPTGKLTVYGGDSSGTTPQMAIEGGAVGTIGDLYVLDSKNTNTGIGWAAKAIGINIQNQVNASNQVLQRTTNGGITGAGAIYLGADDVNQGVFGVLGSPQGSTTGTVLTEYLTVRGNGNVGIGTTNPSLAKLQVQGGIAIGKDIWHIDTDGNNKFYFASGGTTYIRGNAIQYRNQSDVDIVHFANNGTVGLGTNSPTSELYVTRPLSLGATGKALAIFDQIENQDIFTASASGTTRFVIQNGGNVGIGTTNPTNKLHIYGDDQTLKIEQDPGLAGDTTLQLTSAGAANYAAVDIYGAHLFRRTDGGTKLYIGSDNTLANAKVSIDYSGGNVGIGTTNPGNKLEVNGNTNILGTNMDSNVGTPTLNANGAFIAVGDFVSAQTFTNGIGVKFNDSGTAHSSIKYLSSSDRMDFCGSSANSTLTCSQTPTLSLLTLNAVGGGNVGIGTTAPARKLDVQQTTDSVTTGLGIANAAVTKRLNLWVDASNISHIDGGGGDSNVSINGSSTGFVGIGTTTPINKLDILGNSHTTYGGRNIFGDDGSYNPIFKQYRWTGSASTYYPSAITTYSPDGSTRMSFQVGASANIGSESLSTAMTILQGGSVGIGTIGPGRMLEIYANNTSDNLLRLTNAGQGYSSTYYTAGTSQMYVGQAADTVNWNSTGTGTGFMQTSGNLVLASPLNTPRLTILASSGNVGIGITNPTAQLDVKGVGDTANQISLQLRSGNTAANFNSNQITLGYSNTDTYRHAIKSRHNSGAQAGNSLDFYVWNQGTDASTAIGTKQVMTLDGNGNVGIGTTTPDAQLKVYGAGQTTTALTDAGNTGGTIFLQDSNGASGNGGAVLFGAGADRFAAIKAYYTDGTANGVGDLAFSTRNGTADTALTERMRILSGGNVGIGTSAPGDQLTIKPSTTSKGLTIRETDNGFDAARLTADNDTGYLDLKFQGTTKIHLGAWSGDNSYFNSGANVGIGTTTPTDSILTINANSGNTTTSGGISLLGTNSNYGMRTTVYDTGTGIQGQFVLKVAGAYDATPAMVIGGAGNTRNVGIGTTTPSEKLSVAGNAIATGNISAKGISTPSLASFGLNSASYQYGITNSPTWNVTNGSYVNNNATAPDGTTTAGTYTLSTTSWDLYQTIAVTSGTAYKVGVWVKLGTATNFCVVVNNGSAWNTVGGKCFTSADGLSTTGWTYVPFTFTGPATGTINLHVGANSETSAQQQTAGTVYVWNWEVTKQDGGTMVSTFNGNVGIGTTSPTARLQVATPGGGNLYVSDYGCGAFGGIGGNATLTGCTNYALLTAGTDTYINRPTGSAIRFRESNGEQMIIATGGNVGIGTTGPLSKFHVAGGSTAPTGELGSALVTGSTTAMRLAMGVNNTSTMYSWLQSVENGVNSRALSLNPNGGNVGIGLTGPTGKLHVIADTLYNDGSGFRLQSSSGGTGNLLFMSTSTAGDYAAIQSYKDGTGVKNLLLNAMGGNVGIGTSTPGYALSVAGVIQGQATANSGDVLRVGNDSKLVDIDVANTMGIYSISDPTIGSVKLGSAGPTLAGTSGLLTLTGGLTISGTLDPNGAVTLPTTGISGAGAGSGLDADLLDGQNLASASTVSTVVGRDGNGDINVRLVRSEYDTTNATIGYIMTQIDTVSNNYIRPSTPAQLVTGLGLEAGGSRDIWVEKAGDNMTGGLNIYNVTSGGSLGIAKQADATYYMQLGMDNSYIQYVANNAYWNGTQYNYVNTGGYGGLASAMRQVSGEISFNTASGGTNPITWSQRMTIQNGGNVGVGDTTPAALFTVGTSDAFQVASSGNITTAGTLAVNGDTITADGNLTINPAGGNLYVPDVLRSNVGGAGYGQYGYDDNYHSLITRGYPSSITAAITPGDVTSLVEYGGDFRFYQTNGTVNTQLFRIGGNLIYGNSKEMFDSGDSWLRINDGSAFTSGIYAGTGILRTDGNFQIGSGGSSFNVTSAGVVTGGTYNGQTISSAANFTGSITVTSNSTINNIAIGGNRVYANSGTNFHLDAFSTGATYLNYFAGTGGAYICNGANVCPTNISPTGAITATSLNVGSGAITSGLINGQTISSAANFTGTTNTVGLIYGNSKEIFNTGDAYLRINQSGAFASGTWFGSTNIMAGTSYLALGSNGGTTLSNIYFYGGAYDGTNNIALNGTTGTIAQTFTGTTTDAFTITANDITTGSILELAGDFSGSAATGYGVRNILTDSTATANTDYGYYGTLNLSGNAAKTAYGIYQSVNTTSTTADTVYGLYADTTINGALSTGTRSIYGVRGDVGSLATNTGGIINLYGGYFVTQVLGTGGTQNQHGVYISNGTSTGAGVTTKYGLYVENQTGADTNYAAYFAGGEIRMAGGAFINGVDSIEFAGSQDWKIEQNTAGAICNAGRTGELCFYTGGAAPGDFAITNAGVIYSQGTMNASQADPDVAENIRVNDLSIEAGDIVSSYISEESEVNIYEKTRASKSTARYDSRIIGAISTNPGIYINSKNFSGDVPENEKPLAIAGRIPIKVSNMNGDIQPGDYITSSDIPGIGMKATNAGRVVGVALSEYIDSDATQSAKLVDGQWVKQNGVCQVDEVNCEDYQKILVFINPSFQDPDAYLTSGGDLNIFTLPSVDNGFEVRNENNELITRIGGYSEIVTAKIRAGRIEAVNIVTNIFNATTANITNLTTETLAIATSNITIAGQNITDFISGIVDQRIAQNGGNGNIISPIELEGENIVAKLPNLDSKLIVKNSSGSAVASIDNDGNASISGKLKAESVDTNEASIAGTLRAKKIIADDIDLSSEALAKLEGKLSTNSATIVNNYYISTPSSVFGPSENATNSSNLNFENATGSAIFGDLSAQTATFTNGLMSFGPTSFFEASVADRLFIGSQLSIANNSINVLGGNFEIQPLGQGGVSLVAGLVEIDTRGNLKVDGNAFFAKDVDVKGRLATNIISPLSGQDLIFDFIASGSATPSNIQFRNGTGSAVLAINNKGDILSSGSGTFAKLNINLVTEAQALSDTEIVATGSAGLSEIKANQEEITIINPLVTEKSLIYITPKTSTPNQSIYLLRQTAEDKEQNGIEGSFTVGISSPINKKVPFNWIIIN